MKRLNILLTAVGGDIGFSVYKILREQNFINNLICSDISSNNPGAHICKIFEILPKASEDSYLTALENLVKKYSLDLIIPLSEAELRYFSKNRIRNMLNAQILMASQKATEIGFDKYATIQFLKNNRLSYPRTIKIKSGKKPYSYPCIIKNPIGCGNKATFIAENEEDFNFYSAKFPGYIAQQYISGDEYTCGVYRGRDKGIRTIIFKRELQGGITGHGALIHDARIETLLVKVAENLELYGSINVQLRMNDSGIYIFEINPRFSSTVLFRHKLNFKDLIWSIQDFCDEEIDKYEEEAKPVEFYRMYDEFILYK